MVDIGKPAEIEIANGDLTTDQLRTLAGDVLLQLGYIADELCRRHVYIIDKALIRQLENQLRG